MTAKIKRVKHNGGIRELKARLDAAKRLSVVAGVMGPAGASPHGGLTVAQIGHLHEYGYSFTIASGSRAGERVTVPARSFIRAPVRAAEPKLRRALAAAAAAAVKGEDPVPALQRAGVMAAGVMQKAMSAGLQPPLAPSTVAARQKPRKGHKGERVIKPLVDTGQLRGAITSAVRSR